jgi:hypothetical protein
VVVGVVVVAGATVVVELEDEDAPQPAATRPRTSVTAGRVSARLIFIPGTRTPPRRIASRFAAPTASAALAEASRLSSRGVVGRDARRDLFAVGAVRREDAIERGAVDVHRCQQYVRRGDLGGAAL